MTTTSPKSEISSTPATPPAVLYLVYREGLSSVFESMVLAPLSEMRRAGRPARLAVFAPLGTLFRRRVRQRWRTMKQAIEQALQSDFDVLLSPPSRMRGCWDESRQLVRLVRRRYNADQAVVLHCRGAQAATLAIKAKRVCPNIRILYDMRGVQYAERAYEEFGADPDGQGQTVTEADVMPMKIENLAAREADAMICVSSAMREFAVTTFGVPSEKIMVVPNHTRVERFIDARGQREGMRERLGLADRLVVAYCGSIYRRQRVDIGMKFCRLMKDVDPSVHLLALTQQPEAMRTMASKEELQDAVTAFTVTHDDVPRYLAAADLGLITTGLLERPVLANQVCSPVKFAEYLAAGLPVLMAEGVGDYPRVIHEQKIGWVVPSAATPEDLQRLARTVVDTARNNANRYRRRCIEAAEQELNSRLHVGRIEKLYARLAEA